MEYKNTEWTIKVLLDLIKHKSINLRPPYQRNFIWTPKDQRLLIDSIHKGYPLPNFFILENEDGKYEMVDGQQRAITIYKYHNGEFKDSQKKYYSDYNPESFLNYKLNIVVLKDFDASKGESKEEFFYLVNKRGVHLNPAEVNQAYYHDTDFLKLVNRILDDQKLIDLDIFTDRTKIRMNDRGLIEELVAYLFCGITEKRNAVEDLFDTQISEDEANKKYDRFSDILDRLYTLNNSIKPINQTRYKQKNDFYTLFCFVNEHIEDEIDVLKYQYRILSFISDHEFISPSNEYCRPFMDYAINCVSQSNSKRARELRLLFFESILCNRTDKSNSILREVRRFLCEEFEVDYINWVKKGDYYLIDLSYLS